MWTTLRSGSNLTWVGVRCWPDEKFHKLFQRFVWVYFGRTLTHVRFSDELTAVGGDFFASFVLKFLHLLTPFLEPKDLFEKKTWPKNPSLGGGHSGLSYEWPYTRLVMGLSVWVLFSRTNRVNLCICVLIFVQAMTPNEKGKYHNKKIFFLMYWESLLKYFDAEVTSLWIHCDSF